MEKRLQHIREKQKKRRELLAKQLGVESGAKLASALNSKDTCAVKSSKRKQTNANSAKDDDDKDLKAKINKVEQAKQPSFLNQQELKDGDYDSGEMKVYKDSSTFLKGTQSLNPHNDYCQNYVDTGQRPQNFIRDVGLAERFGEYPKLKDLIQLKDELIRKTNTPPTYLKRDLKTFNLSELGCKFDVILIEPPLVEYKKQAGQPLNGSEATWENVMSLAIGDVAGPRSFVFLWCGSSDGLDNGRKCLSKWGFRRCEDICWIKTNLKKTAPVLADESLLVRTKEHCLMGIKGTVRRSTDGDFIHANVDIDLIIDEEQEPGSCEKPEEIFHVIEHFCLGRRRLHLYGRDTSIRPGWLTVGPQLTNSNFDRETYANHFKASDDNSTGLLTGCTDEIERLRPKTPPPREKKSERGGLTSTSGRGGRGRGALPPRRGDHQSSRSERGTSSPAPPSSRSGAPSSHGSSSPYQFLGERDGAQSLPYRSESRNRSSHKRDSSRDRSSWRDSSRSGHRNSRGDHPSYQSR